MRIDYIPVICIIFLFISSCTSTVSKTQLSMKDFRVGIKGITMQFVPDNNPLKVMQSDQLVSNILLKNEGAASSSNVYLMFATEKDYVSVTSMTFDGKPMASNSLIEALAGGKFNGKSPNNPAGDFGQFEAALATKKITLSKLQETLMTATICYDYYTAAEASVCVQPVKSVALPQACIPKDVALTSQGAPVAVTKIEVKNTALPNNIVKSVFRIAVENKGSGDVLYSGSSKVICSSNPLGINANKIWNYFLYQAYLGSNPMPLKCRGETNNLAGKDFNVGLFKNKKAEIICETTTPAASAYQTPLTINLYYDYTETISRQLIIEKV